MSETEKVGPDQISDLEVVETVMGLLDNVTYGYPPALSSDRFQVRDHKGKTSRYIRRDDLKDRLEEVGKT